MLWVCHGGGVHDIAVPADTTAPLRGQRFAWYTYGWASHTFETLVVTVFMSRYLPTVAENAVGKHGRVHVLGIPIAAASLFAYVVSLSAILLIVLMPIVGALADRTGRKRELMLAFGYVGALSCVAMWFVAGTDWELGALLMIVAYVGYTCAKVVFNSFLPDLAAPDERDRVSSFGWAIAYIGGGLLLAAMLGLSFGLHDDALLARIALSASGIWWAVFAVVPLRKLRNPASTAPHSARRSGSVLVAGFRELGDTLRHAWSFKLTLLFLLAYLVYYDGVNTVTTLSADYGQKELGLSNSTLLSAILIVQFAAFGGALLLGRLAQRTGAKRVLVGSLVVWIAVVGAAYFLQAGKPLQFYLLAMVLSVVLGGTQALSRSLFAGMIPHGKEAEYFSLYEVSSSGSSALGPLVFALALQETGSYRSAIVSLVVFFVVGLALVVPLNMRKAIAAAGNPVPATLT